MSIESKKIQRKQLIKIRNNIKSDDLTAKSLIIENRLFDIVSYYGFETVFAFAPFNNEVNIFGLIRRLLKGGIKLALPRVEKNTMNFYSVDNLDSLIKNKMGILEPDITVSQRIAYDIDFYNSLMIVPLLGFDDNLNRIGYGGGYYDRYLTKYPNNKFHITALAYEYQIYNSLPVNENDKPINLIVTETRYINNINPY